MQILGVGSDEGKLPGLGWIGANAKLLTPPRAANLKVPHIGWADVDVVKDCAIFPERLIGERFYFVHSYALQCADPSVVAATANFGDPFCCAVSRENIHGTQFHPEKSHKFGMRLLKSFASYD
jgi:imidazole glycerol-phosphate synthase subunit HisH